MSELKPFLAFACCENSEEAYVFRVHQKHGKESEYLRYMSRLGAGASITTAVAAVVGGYLYLVHPAIPYAVQGILMLVATWVSTKMENAHVPPAHDVNLKTQLGECFRLVRSGNGFVLATALLVSGTATYEIFNNLVNQSYWQEVGIGVGAFGWLGLAVFVIDGVIVHQTPLLSETFGKWIWFWIGAAVVGVGTGIHYSSSFVSVAVLSGLLSGVFAVSRRVFDQHVQERVDSESVRASFLSFLNTVSNLAIRATFFMAVLVVSGHGYRDALFLLCTGFGLATMVLGIAGAKAFSRRTVLSGVAD